MKIYRLYVWPLTGKDFRSVALRIFLLSTYCLVLSTLIGCDAFVRKFTRKPKKQEFPKEEVILVPEVYKPSMSKEEQYRQYFLFWKSWQDEIIEALNYGKNHKKQVKSSQEALKNLLNLRPFLHEKKQKELDGYIDKLKNLRDAIANDPYGSNKAMNLQRAESLKRNILREFTYHKEYLL